MLCQLIFLSLAAAWAPLYKQAERVEGSYIVVFNDRPQNFATIDNVEGWLSKNFNGITNVTKSVYLINPDGQTRFRGFAADLSLEQVQVLQLSLDVAYIEEDSIVSVSPIQGDADPAADWGVSRVDQRCLPINDKADPCTPAEGAPKDCTGAGALAWIVDTGIRTTHQEFHGRASIAANFAAGDPSTGNGDCNGHGTHVAGSVGGKGYGVVKDIELRSVRVLNCQGSGTAQNVIDGYNFIAANKADKKLNILSASIGGGLSQSQNDAINAVAAKGIVCVVAAGNNNANACNYSPSSATQVITVGATTNTDARASFSNFGTCVNVFAPGSNINSAWFTSDSSTNILSGTSMATPLVTGSVAVLGADINTSFEEMIKMINAYSTAGVVGGPGVGSPNQFIYDRWNDGTPTTC